MYKTYNARAERLFLLIKPIVLWRSRCRCRRRCLSSLMLINETSKMGRKISGELRRLLHVIGFPTNYMTLTMFIGIIKQFNKSFLH